MYLKPKSDRTKSERKHYMDRAWSIYYYMDRLVNKDK